MLNLLKSELKWLWFLACAFGRYYLNCAEFSRWAVSTLDDFPFPIRHMARSWSVGRFGYHSMYALIRNLECACTDSCSMVWLPQVDAFWFNFDRCDSNRSRMFFIIVTRFVYIVDAITLLRCANITQNFISRYKIVMSTIFVANNTAATTPRLTFVWRCKIPFAISDNWIGSAWYSFIFCLGISNYMCLLFWIMNTQLLAYAIINYYWYFIVQ